MYWGILFLQLKKRSLFLLLIALTSCQTFSEVEELRAPASTASASTAFGTAGYLAKFDSTSTLGNSPLYSSAGKIGIGTTSPAASLDINLGVVGWNYANFGISQTADAANGAGLVGTALTLNNSTANATAYNRLIRDAGTVYLGYELGATSRDGIRFATSSVGTPTEAMRITSDGKIGIGTVTPISKLHVVGASAVGTTEEVLRLQAGADADNSRASMRIMQAGNSRGLIFEGGRENGNRTVGKLAITDSANTMIGEGITLLQDVQGGAATYVGIGTAEPAANLDVLSKTANASIRLTSTESSNITAVQTIGFGTNISGTYTPTGVLGDTSSGDENFKIFALRGNLMLGAHTNGASTRMVINAAGGVAIGAYGNDTPPVDGLIVSGAVGIGTNAPGFPLDVVGDIRTSTCIHTAAGVVAGFCGSDQRIKTNIHEFKLGLKALQGIQPKYYRFNGLGGYPKTDKDELGIIAQDVEKTAPELIERKMVKLHPADSKETEIKIVNYSGLIYVVINSIKEFYHEWKNDSTELHQAVNELKKDATRTPASIATQDRITQLEKENAALREQSAKLEARLNRLEKQIAH